MEKTQFNEVKAYAEKHNLEISKVNYNDKEAYFVYGFENFEALDKMWLEFDYPSGHVIGTFKNGNLKIEDDYTLGKPFELTAEDFGAEEEFETIEDFFDMHIDEVKAIKDDRMADNLSRLLKDMLHKKPTEKGIRFSYDEDFSNYDIVDMSPMGWTDENYTTQYKGLLFK